MKTLKTNFLIALCTIVMCIAGIAGFLWTSIPFKTVQADKTYTITTDKTTYTIEEKITVTVSSAEGALSKSDYVAIFAEDDLYMIMYYYPAEGITDGFIAGGGDGITIHQPEKAKLEPGNYKIVLLPGDKPAYPSDNFEESNIVAETEIVIKNYDPPAVPTSVTFTPATVQRYAGSAEGTLTIIGSGATEYIAYWADENGPIEGYGAFPSIFPDGNGKGVYKTNNCTLIPNNADRIIVYASYKGVLSQSFATGMLPENRIKYDFGTPLYEFQVISDIHQTELAFVTSTKNFDIALADIKANSPNSIGVFINGDIADNGTVANYQFYLDKISKADLPFGVYASIGNHDWYQHTDAYFKQYANPTLGPQEKVYFDFWAEGAHFIFLGGDAEKDEAILSQEQLDWFKQKLEENRDSDRPIYVFLHQGLGYTVAGTFGDTHAWTETIVQGDELREILKDYPEVVMFSSHTHQTMNDIHSSMHEKGNNLPTIFNTAAVISNSVGIGQSAVTGAQGLYLTVYEDVISVQGRDFLNGEWIPAAQFYVDLANHTYDGDCDDSCNDCGAPRNAPHNFSTDWTADESGHWHICNDCQTSSSVQAHELSAWVKNDISHYKECSVCGEKVSQEEHVFGEWVIIKEATTSSTGTREKTCVCGKRIEETIPKLGQSSATSSDNSSNNSSDDSSTTGSGCNSLINVSSIPIAFAFGACVFAIKKKKE